MRSWVEKSKTNLILLLVIAVVTFFCFGYALQADAASGSDQTTKTEVTGKSQPDSETVEKVYVMQKANGKDYKRIVDNSGELEYEGYEDASLPVTMTVEYTLDGEAITAKDLAGKSGHVTIDIKYENHAKVDGTTVPFMAITGVIFKDDDFSNVTVSGRNGKVLSEGSNTIAAGFALPGLKDAVGLGSNVVYLPDTLSIEADTSNYNVGEIYSFVSNSMFQDMDWDDVEDMDDLSSKLDDLKDKAKELTKGTEQLKDGSVQISDGASKLYAASKTIKSGAKKVSDGNAALKKKTPELTNGIGQLAEGAKQLDDGNTALAGGLKKLYGEAPSKDSKGSGTQLLGAGADSLSAGLSTLYKNDQTGGTTKLEEGAKELKEGLSATSGIDQLAGANAAVASGVKDGIIAELKKSTGIDSLTADNYEATLNGAIQKYTAAGDTETVGKLTAALYQTKGALGAVDKYESVYSKKTKDGFATLKTSVGKASKGAELIYGGVKTVNENLKEKIIPGAKQLSGGVAAVNQALAKGDEKSGTPAIIESAEKLAAGAGQLDAGIAKLQGGSKKLAEGVNKLSSGSMTLYKGTVKFSNKEGELAKGAKKLAKGAKTLDSSIDKAVNNAKSQLRDLGIDDAENVIDRIQNIDHAGKGYTSFEGGKKYKQVDFIYKLEGVTK